MPPLTLSNTAQRAFAHVAADLRRVFGPRLVALVATGPHASVAFVSDLQAADLDALGALVHTWRHDHLETPLVLGTEEFRRSLEMFPAEYQAMLDRHVVIDGQPPFAGVTVDPRALRRACDAQARGLLIHLRQGWIEAAGHDHQLAALLTRSAAPLGALLGNVARLHAGNGADPAAGARLAGLDEGLVGEILALEHAPDRAHGLVGKLPAYLLLAEHLWGFVDRWQS